MSGDCVVFNWFHLHSDKLTKEEEDIHRLRHDLRKASISNQPCRQAPEVSHYHSPHYSSFLTKHTSDCEWPLFPCSLQDSKPPLPSTGKPFVTAKDGGNKQQIRDTIRMIVRGTLGSCSSSSECMCFACAFVMPSFAASWFSERMFSLWAR